MSSTQPHVEPITPGPGQRSAWDFPTPPRVGTEKRLIRVYVGGIPVVSTNQARRVLETGLPPTIYVPSAEFKHCEIRRLKHTVEDEYKGTATLFTVIAGGKIAHRSLWTFLDPHGPYRSLMGHFGVYPGRVDKAYIDQMLVEPQEGTHHAGWITSDIVGPFKGAPGTEL